ncbi:AAA family ATPase [Kamptonema formosum]|uniref:AAA family ATPase n=1 Tax=Kamptonema formosum TaxID=331992 RepID=UPI00034523DC|nr:hypothetical protein [Oscillatoria sp. PCC 10802]
MSENQNPVPRLDLAPKLKRRLFLWNPLDYLRVLYWVFFFPQALRWYVDTFGEGYIPEKEMNLRKGWELLRQNRIERNLLLQGLILTVVTPLAAGAFLEQIGVPVDWRGVALGVGLGVGLGMASGVALGVALGVASGVALGVASGLASGVASGLASGLTLDVMLDLMSGVAFGVAWGVGLGVALGVMSGVASGVTSGVAWDALSDAIKEVMSGVGLGVALGVVSGVVSGVGLGVGLGVALSVALCVASSVALGVAILRVENWLFSVLLTPLKLWNKRFQLSRVTPVPLPFVSRRLANWLRQDWEAGLHNVNQVLAYTLQFIPAVKAVNKVLAETPAEQLIFRVAQIAENPYDWQLVRFASGYKRPIIGLKKRELRPDTPARAAAAGFWYLHAKNARKAAEAFAEVSSLLYGEEMLAIAQTLEAFDTASELADIAAVRVPAFPKDASLRPATWKALAGLRRVVEDMQNFERGVSPSNRSFALNRALGELTGILDKTGTLPQAERDLIAFIAKNWQESLLEVAAEVGAVSIGEPVRNPYVVGDPVEGQLLFGRDDIMRKLEELWGAGNQLQSVLIFGHRRTGKTSILRSAGNSLGSGITVAYVNLLTVANTSQGVSDVLMAICDAISSQAHCTLPDETKLLTFPYHTFERYLKQVEANLEGGLIIALDEFEEIETLIEAGKLPPSFMVFLRGMMQVSPKIAFAFAGSHTLEEMKADYFQPFFSSVIPIRIGFLTPAIIRQILGNPDRNFPLDYTPEALDRIYALTSGQPYLVQLIGFQMVRWYNDVVFEMGRLREPVFSVDDVEMEMDDQIFRRGRYYFTGIWEEAARGAAGQQAILRALAPHAEGLTLREIAEAADVGSERATAALDTLERHDVVAKIDSRWRIVVELFRRWVLKIEAGGQQ